MEFCIICKDNLVNLNINERNDHINKCLDQENIKHKKKKKYCDICGKNVTKYTHFELKNHLEQCNGEVTNKKPLKRLKSSRITKHFEKVNNNMDIQDKIPNNCKQLRKEILDIDRQIEKLRLRRDELVDKLQLLDNDSEEDEEQPGLISSQPNNYPVQTPPNKKFKKCTLLDLTATPQPEPSNSNIYKINLPQKRHVSNIDNNENSQSDLETINNDINDEDTYVLSNNNGSHLKDEFLDIAMDKDDNSLQNLEDLLDIMTPPLENHEPNSQEKKTNIKSSSRCKESNKYVYVTPEKNENEKQNMSLLETPNYANMKVKELKSLMNEVGCKTTVPKARMVQVLTRLWRFENREDETENVDNLSKNKNQFDNQNHENNEMESISEKSKKKKKSKTKKVKRDPSVTVIEFIRAHPSIFQQVLLFQPLEFTYLHQIMKKAGIKHGRDKVRTILDDLGVVFKETTINQNSVKHINRESINI